MPFPPSKKKKRRNRLGIPTLMLTSMMDMFTIILLFLLVNYSAQGEITSADPKKLILPVSTSQKPPNLRLIIQATSDDIMVDGAKVTEIKDALKKEDYLIKPILDALNINTEKVEFIAKNNSSVKFTGEVLIQGDRNIPFQLLEKIMYTCGQAGYSNISLSVISSE